MSGSDPTRVPARPPERPYGATISLVAPKLIATSATATQKATWTACRAAEGAAVRGVAEVHAAQDGHPERGSELLYGDGRRSGIPPVGRAFRCGFPRGRLS